MTPINAATHFGTRLVFLKHDPSDNEPIKSCTKRAWYIAKNTTTSTPIKEAVDLSYHYVNIIDKGVQYNPELTKKVVESSLAMSTKTNS